MDNAALIEECEDEFWQIVQKMHKGKIRYSAVHHILLEIVKTLELQAHCEDWWEQNCN